MDKLDYKTNYKLHVEGLKHALDLDLAMQQAVGGNFKAFGLLEKEILIQNGLLKQDYLIDIGCGSGRLTIPLSDYLEGRYLGTDVVPDLLEYARKSVNRSGWRFELVDRLEIPEQDSQADMVCFFSVFTHLLHEQSYIYLKEAKRVLKPTGKIVFSFLEFSIDRHWNTFEGNLNNVDRSTHLNMFIGRDAILAWAKHLELNVISIHDGDKPFIHLSEPIVRDDGTVLKDIARFGQSVCILGV